MNLMKCGLYAEIIDQKGKYVTVRFEDGMLVDSTFAKFSCRDVERPIIPNEQRFTKSGRLCYLKTYHSSKNVDVIFPNGDYINKISYRDFLNGNIDDRMTVSYLENCCMVQFFTFIIFSFFCSGVYYNQNNFDVYITPLDIGINFKDKYAKSKDTDYKGASIVFTIAERDAKIVSSSNNTIYRLSNNRGDIKGKRNVESYFYDLEQQLKEMGKNIGINPDLIRITDGMLETVFGRNKRWNYKSYLFADELLKQ